ncbi:Protein of unknown function [Pyronema omphalodes CBS 100304]|uniref:Uncharacterized protein n=1 Tax=Pyronema omphalodes (strain CBS 100304) TaxID=1076935 RepID=U4LRZ2_PYROM|nr:Protein of unknown function [Pyronema omphalodes CBS 100304]
MRRYSISHHRSYEMRMLIH